MRVASEGFNVTEAIYMLAGQKATVARPGRIVVEGGHLYYCLNMAKLMPRRRKLNHAHSWPFSMTFPGLETMICFFP